MSRRRRPRASSCHGGDACLHGMTWAGALSLASIILSSCGIPGMVSLSFFRAECARRQAAVVHRLAAKPTLYFCRIIRLPCAEALQGLHRSTPGDA